jgi:hypothetical protein
VKVGGVRRKEEEGGVTWNLRKVVVRRSWAATHASKSFLLTTSIGIWDKERQKLRTRQSGWVRL